MLPGHLFRFLRFNNLPSVDAARFCINLSALTLPNMEGIAE
jgi:hypothetical protein